jgi:hypothetical protein
MVWAGSPTSWPISKRPPSNDHASPRLQALIEVLQLSENDREWLEPDLSLQDVLRTDSLDVVEGAHTYDFKQRLCAQFRPLRMPLTPPESIRNRACSEYEASSLM